MIERGGSLCSFKCCVVIKKTCLLILAMLPFCLFSQGGTIRGTVIDNDTGETVPFANVLVVENQTGTTSDLDGAFALSIGEGTYTLEISFLGYSTVTISEVAVSPGEVTLIDDIRLYQESELIEEIVVSSVAIRNTETAILTIQKKSPNLLDGISSQTFRKIGDSDAASAIRRVTGVSVEGGKYVFVRGLGDRYTKSILNGMDIPGLDPDRNTLQMDIFPTNLIDNILVLKSFTPDLPGDFTGGVVDIVTKDFPEEKSFSVSATAGLNPDMHFNQYYLKAPGGGMDFLGMDDGTRDLPIDRNAPIPAPIPSNANAQTLTDMTSAFNPDMAVRRGKSFMNYSVGIAAGNQINKEKATWGYNMALSYKNNTDYYDLVQYNSYRKNDLGSEDPFGLETTRTQLGNFGSNNVFVSGLLGGAVKFKNHKIVLNLIRLQNGQSTAGDFFQESFFPNSNQLFRDNLEYSERAITNALLKGKHTFQARDLTIDWSLSPTMSSINDKDIRVSPFRFDDGVYSIEPSEGAEPRRIWRELEETNISGRVDVTKKLKLGDRESKLKFGFSGTLKQRDYAILTYRVNARSQSFLDIDGDPDALFQPENIWTPETRRGTFLVGNIEPANMYDASQQILAGYVMNELPLGDNIKAIYGLRVEKFDHRYTGQNNLGDEIYDNEKIIDVLDLLPSANLVYGLSDNANLRVSYSRTLARPSFKEASIAEIYDALTDRTFIGNIDLEETKINNFDARLEYFQSGGQMLSVSGFYKAFTDPIEVVAFNQAAPDNFQPRNVGDAKVYGIEVEARKNLHFISESLRSFSIGTNLTFVHSEVEMNENELLSRIENARPGEEIGTTREMQGQSPYIINALLSYNGLENGVEATMSYNVQGERLSIVGIGRNPDVFEQPFHALNLKLSKRLGPEGRIRASVSVQNILSDERQKDYTSFGASNEIFELLRPERTYRFGFSYSL